MEGKKEINVLTVCGAGVVTSAMLGSVVKEILEKLGLHVNLTETMVGQVRDYVESGNIDLIVTTSPIEFPVNNIPVVKGNSLLYGGDNEKECIEEIIKVGKEILERT